MSKSISGLSEETHKEFHIFKYKSGFKSAEEALKSLLERSRKKKEAQINE